jgi:hypothetical protein
MLGDTRSSPHPSVVTLGCLNGREECGVGQGCYPYKYKCDSEHEYFEGMDKR